MDLSWLALGDGRPPEPAVGGHEGGRGPGDPNGPEDGAAGASEDADVDATAESSEGGVDDVPSGLAARALGVSRTAVERMVNRGELERGPSNAPATVSERSLAAMLEARRRVVGELTRAMEIEESKSPDQQLAGSSLLAAAAELTELVPVLAPLIDEFMEARTRAAALEDELCRLQANERQARARDERLRALAAQGWWGRRQARQAVLRQHGLGEHQD